jgi:hypothetical protein
VKGLDLTTWVMENGLLLAVVGAAVVVGVLVLWLARRLLRSRAQRAGQLVRATTRVPIRRGIPAVNVTAEDTPAGAVFPMLAQGGRVGGHRIRFWLYPDRQGLVSPGTVGVSGAMERVLGLPSTGLPVTIAMPDPVLVKVVPAPALDLPKGASIHVSPSVYARFRRQGRWRRALLTTPNGVAFPVRLHKRPLASELAQVPMALRTLAGIKVDTQVQLSELPRITRWERYTKAFGRVFESTPRGSLRRNLGVLLGLVMLVLRAGDYLLELFLRLTLRSQPMCFRVVQANPGDDDLADTVKLHHAAFTALAARPGGQVTVTWAGQRVSVRALEDPTPITDQPSEHVLNSVGLHLDVEPLPPGFPAHLVVRMPAPMRRTLNIPPDTIVEVRRRLRPAATAQLNAVTIPTAGLVLAGAALPAVRGWPLAVGALTSLVLGLAPLRSPRAPRGQWP